MGSAAADRLLRQVLALPADERTDLLRRLKRALASETDQVLMGAATMPDEIRAAWVEVALERLERHSRGESGPSIGIDEVERRLADSLREP